MELKLAATQVSVNEEGFLTNLKDWNQEIALVLAECENIEMTAEHWEIVNFIREYYQNFKHLPNARVFTKAIRNTFGADKGNSRYLHKLFPQGPLKYACKVAGLPKPPTCL